MPSDDAQPSRGPAASGPLAPLAAWRTWGPTLAVIGALALAHLGLGLVLTRAARSTVDEIEGTWEVSVLDAAREPGPEPLARGDEWVRWQRSQRLWADVQRREDRVGWISALTWGLGGSFALQAGLVAWIALRAGTRRSAR